ncbi:hypothetical protein JB92DRAFT_951913 [Gautieria morchelliformis]|nr:hypothetical protein JB92DRAFT_951913 [Gautieria morchelliformis]
MKTWAYKLEICHRMGLYFLFCLSMEFSFAILVSSARIVNSSTFASLAFLLYDHVLTFDAEVQLVWNYPGWIFGKVLFLFNRYLGPFTLIPNILVHMSPSVSLKVCSGFRWVVTTSEAITVFSVQLILMTRIYAVYERNRKLLVLFGMLFVAEIAGSIAVVDMGLPRGIPRPSGISTGCYVAAQPPLYFIAWIPEIIGESILCLLMLYKAWTMYKNSQSSSLLGLIIRDSVLYFVTMFAILLINCLVSAFASVNYLEVAISWTIALPCSLGSRLMLNMRERIFFQKLRESRTRE